MSLKKIFNADDFGISLGVNAAIEKALKMADEAGVKGKDITPFLLKTIVDLTGGDSLESNIRLVLNNAALGSEIAKELTRL